MKKIGLICEYNPFHNGHVYHIDTIKKMYPDSVLILVLGSYFLERGDVSIISKWNKTKIALDYGIDLVIELPTLYGTNSADYFAYYAVRALSLAEVDTIVFGSESSDIVQLKAIAHSQTEEEFDERVKDHLKNGTNYPTSLSKSLGITLKSNDLLGVSYIKAIKKLCASIDPVAIQRTNDFRDDVLDDAIVSASNVREKIKKGCSIDKYIPKYDRAFINRIDEEKMFSLLKYRIITEKHLERFLGVDEGLENKLKKEILSSQTLEELIEKIKSKRYTTSRLKRMLIHILLGIEKEDMNTDAEAYRILGFTEKGKNHLKSLNTDKLRYKMQGRSEEVEKNAALVYYELTGDASVEMDFLNKPIINERKRP